MFNNEVINGQRQDCFEGLATLGRSLTVKEVANLLQTSTLWVYKHWRGLGGRKIGGHIRFFENTIVERIMENS